MLAALHVAPERGLHQGQLHCWVFRCTAKRIIWADHYPKVAVEFTPGSQTLHAQMSSPCLPVQAQRFQMRGAASAADLLGLVAVGDKDEVAAAGHSCISLQPCNQAHEDGRQGCSWQAAGAGCLACHLAHICTARTSSGQDRVTPDRAVPCSSTYWPGMPCSQFLTSRCHSQTERTGTPTVDTLRHSTWHISVRVKNTVDWPIQLHHMARLSSATSGQCRPPPFTCI